MAYFLGLLGWTVFCIEMVIVPNRSEGVSPTDKLVSLEIVSLDKTKITDGGLLRLADLPNLYRLRVGKTSVIEEGVTEFRRRKPKCTVAWPSSSLDPPA